MKLAALQPRQMRNGGHRCGITCTSPIASLGTQIRATRGELPVDLVPGEINKASCANKPKHDLAGYGRLLSAMKFMRWAIEQEHFPTPTLVMTHFQVCRATAYRWTAALAEAYGIDPAIRHGERG